MSLQVVLNCLKNKVVGPILPFLGLQIVLVASLLLALYIVRFMLALTLAGCCNPSTLMILCCVVIVAVDVKANKFALGNMAFSFDSSVNFSLKPCPH